MPAIDTKNTAVSETNKDLAGDLSSLLPPYLSKRVNALKNLQKEILGVDAKFHEEMHLLECKYAALYEPMYEKRAKIVSGEHEPTEEESKWTLDNDEDKPKSEAQKATDEIIKALKAKTMVTDGEEPTVKGVRDFWLQTFKSTELLSEMIQEHDEPVLQHLKDVRVRMHETKPYGYTIEFHFDENEFFTNRVLTKHYEITTEVDEKDPFSYEGPALHKSTGCKIDWVKGKDCTVKQVKKKQKHSSTGTVRVVTKEEKQNSFFNFFDSPTPDGLRPVADASKQDEENEDGEDQEGLFEADYEIGQFLKDYFVPKAILYFTGDLVDTGSYDDYDEDDEDDEDDEEEDDDDDGEDENDDDEEEDDDEEPAKKNSKGSKSNGKAKMGGKGKGGEPTPSECKQN